VSRPLTGLAAFQDAFGNLPRPLDKLDISHSLNALRPCGPVWLRPALTSHRRPLDCLLRVRFGTTQVERPPPDTFWSSPLPWSRSVSFCHFDASLKRGGPDVGTGLGVFTIRTQTIRQRRASAQGTSADRIRSQGEWQPFSNRGNSFPKLLIIRLVGWEGLEPSTNGLKERRSLPTGDATNGLMLKISGLSRLRRTASD